MKRVVVAGGTGLVGAQVLALLARRDDVHTVALTRRPAGLAVPGRIDERVVAFADPKTFELACDAVFCCVGTTMKAAGSQAAFRQVDYAIPAHLIAGVAKTSPGAAFGLVSSVGADKPRGFYLGVKHEVEALLRASGLRAVVARPSLLVGVRHELRLGERLALSVLPGVFGALNAVTGRKVAAVGKYQPVRVEDVARALVGAVLDDGGAERWRVLSGYDLGKF